MKITPYYFAALPRTFFLSNSSKEEFLKEVDRDSAESKLTGFINYSHYFQLEMDLNQKRFKNNIKTYRYLSGDIFYYIELFAMTLSIINNLILLCGFRMDGSSIDLLPELSSVILVFAIIEIILSLFSLIANIYMQYPLTRAISRQKYLDTHAEKTSLNIFDKLYIDVYISFVKKKNIIINVYHIVFVVLGITTSYGFFIIYLFSSALLFF